MVSRNGHNEFLNLAVNNRYNPGDQINLTGTGSVPVTITWTANQNLSGTIELMHNGIVVATKQASVALGSPATLNTTVNFTKSGWLAARRMGSNGHQVHTGAVFVIVDNLPIRASANDANFYVQWMDNLLTKTSPGGEWNSYFPTKLAEAQARYQAAKEIYQQRANEADTTAPSAPSSLTATPASGTQINLSWTASTDNVGVTGYQVERCQGAGCSSFALITTATGTTYNDTGLTAGTSYTYRVRATDAPGNLSAYSNTATQTTTPPDTTPPDPPTNLRASVASTTQINLSWEIPADNVGVTGYQVERCQGAGCTNFTVIDPAVVTNAFYDIGLSAGTSYTYRVRATDAPGNLSAYSDTATQTTTSPDTTPPAVSSVSPPDGSVWISTDSSLAATFSEVMDPSTISESTIELRDSLSQVVSAEVSYNTSTRTATLNPAAQLGYYTTYIATIKGGATGVKDLADNPLASNYSWSFTTRAQDPNEGPGGPILVIATPTNPFTRYYAEILHTEGLNTFYVVDVSNVSDSTLAGYDTVILGEMSLTTAQVTMLSNWVNAGGNLIAMRPDKKLASFLGLTDASSTLSNAYLLVNTSSGPGQGIVGETIQFHGTADLYTLNGSSAIATFYSNDTTATPSPAVTLRSVGSGRAAAFTYDLAKSVVYTRQGNPSWSGQDRDGDGIMRSDDLFYSDWIDLNKVAIPQADEQQRLLANLIIQMSFDKKPLPRFWYFPRSLEAVVIMTGDDHWGATAARFNNYINQSQTNCSAENWECVRGTAYLIDPGTYLSASSASYYASLGFEVALHVMVGDCANWTPSSLATFYTDQLSDFDLTYPDLPSPVTERTHCIAWSDYDTQPQVQFDHGIRLDTNYYYYPSAWIANRPGMFTGSGMPMRFAKADGTLIDVYQATTQMTDESGQTYPYTINALLDKAIGVEGYYGAFTANMHHDQASSTGADAIIASAKARGIPIISARQMLEWLDGRNSSTFTALAWNGTILTFTISPGQNTNGLMAMVPIPEGRSVTSITRNGAPIAHATETIKGIPYAFFYGETGSYQVTFSL